MHRNNPNRYIAQYHYKTPTYNRLYFANLVKDLKLRDIPIRELPDDVYFKLSSERDREREEEERRRRIREKVMVAVMKMREKAAKSSTLWRTKKPKTKTEKKEDVVKEEVILEEEEEEEDETEDKEDVVEESSPPPAEPQVYEYRLPYLDHVISHTYIPRENRPPKRDKKKSGEKKSHMSRESLPQRMSDMSVTSLPELGGATGEAGGGQDPQDPEDFGYRELDRSKEFDPLPWSHYYLHEYDKGEIEQDRERAARGENADDRGRVIIHIKREYNENTAKPGTPDSSIDKWDHGSISSILKARTRKQLIAGGVDYSMDYKVRRSKAVQEAQPDYLSLERKLRKQHEARFSGWDHHRNRINQVINNILCGDGTENAELKCKSGKYVPTSYSTSEDSDLAGEFSITQTNYPRPALKRIMKENFDYEY